MDEDWEEELPTKGHEGTRKDGGRFLRWEWIDLDWRLRFGAPRSGLIRISGFGLRILEKPPVRLELTTYALRKHRSTTELRRRRNYLRGEGYPSGD